MGALHCTARAKVNLFLGVGEARESGYHDVTTILQSISLADSLSIEPADDLYFRCDEPALGGPENLVVRAAEELRSSFQVKQGAALTLRKRIPAGAGLGGGSADAAAALAGLNVFWKLAAGDDDLAALAAGLGADVPFCLRGGTALATGFGERIRSLPPLDLGPFLIAKPRESLATGLVYETLDGLKNRETKDPERIIQAVEAGDISRVLESLHNDLEPAAQSLAPSVALLKREAIAAGAAAAMVSGSGSSVMVFPSAGADPEDLARELAGHPVQLFIVKCEAEGTVIDLGN